MPRGFSNPSEAKTSLLEASKRWRAEFKAKNVVGQAEAKALSVAVTGALDDIVGVQVHTLDQVIAQNDAINHAAQGADVANKLASEAAQNMESIQEGMEQTTNVCKEMKAGVDESIRRSKSNLNHIQRLQLKETETVLICRNIESLAKGSEETYADMEAAFYAVMDFMRVEVKINHVRRLQRVKSDKARGPATMRVQLASLGDKIKIFSGIEALIKNKVKFNFTFHNEIPPYAMNAFKFLSKIAMEVREAEPDTKTRVGILRADHWPTLTIRRQRATRYTKIDDETFELARAKFNAKAKVQADKRRKEQEERELRQGSADRMDTSNSQPGNT